MNSETRSRQSFVTKLPVEQAVFDPTTMDIQPSPRVTVIIKLAEDPQILPALVQKLQENGEGREEALSTLRYLQTVLYYSGG